ncbi:cysteine desulfurase [Anaerofilum sp. BX8]|uniref:Cysteine desulfurase n=1 Tax=Anaerofilum hominis TaxID=2763016 RepID=A0A923I9L1_9FIRM|nr:cysteine desulfurase family protein [Anaerofilum hominis]MBC5581427.1 cysteine desulfurase [Anaerofilum hominis]
MHYLDNAATTVVDPELAKLCYDTMLEIFGNPSSLYKPGMVAERAVDHARAQVAATLGVTGAEITFTACGTESDNIALQGAAERTKNWAKNIVVTGFEHPAVYRTLELLAAQGWEIRAIPPDAGGHIDEAAFLEAVDEQTGLVAFMFVNNEIGTLLDPVALAKKVRAKNGRASIHVDGVQGWCKHPLQLSGGEIDSFALSGHKMHCPKGVGALYLRRNYRIGPVFGGGGQERGLRPGTENVPYIVTLGAAAEKYGRSIPARLAGAKKLNELLREELAKRGDITVNSPADASPYVLNFSIPGVRSETMLHFLESKEIYVSSGSACSKGAASHTLTAMRLPAARIDGALRVSFCDTSTEEDVRALLNGLEEGLRALQRR